MMVPVQLIEGVGGAGVYVWYTLERKTVRSWANTGDFTLL
jgi:hypothetical protein